MKKLLITILLIVHLTTVSFVHAEPSLIPDPPPPVAGEIDVGAAISPMKKNQTAPFTGVLMSPKAVATLIAEFNNLDAKIKIETDKVRSEEKAKGEFSFSELTIRSGADKKIFEAQLEERDKRIAILVDQVSRSDSNKSNPATWAAVGTGVGFLLGILLTTATVFAVNKASK